MVTNYAHVPEMPNIEHAFIYISKQLNEKYYLKTLKNDFCKYGNIIDFVVECYLPKTPVWKEL